MNWTEQQKFRFVLIYSATHELSHKTSSFCKKYTLLRFFVVGFKRSASNVDPPDFLAVSIAPALNHCDYGTTEALKCCFSKLPWRAITHSLRPSSQSTPGLPKLLSAPSPPPLGLTSTLKNSLNDCFFFTLDSSSTLEARRHREPLVSLPDRTELLWALTRWEAWRVRTKRPARATAALYRSIGTDVADMVLKF